VASLSFVGQSKSQDQPRFKMRGNRIHLLMGGVAVTLHWSMERLVASIFEDSLPRDHTQFSGFTSILQKFFHKNRHAQAFTAKLFIIAKN